MTTTSKCYQCGLVKSDTEFSASALRDHGMCRSCFTEYAKKRRASKNPPIVCLVCLVSKPIYEYRRAKKGWQNVCQECEKTHLQCNTCNQVKIRDEFGTDNQLATGKMGSCHDCVSKQNREFRKSERGRAYKKEYKSRPHVREKDRVYANAYFVRRRREDPMFKQKERARSAVNVAVKKGEMIRPTTCQSNGKYGVICDGDIQAHHYKGYDRENWLVVEWLCESCHKAADDQTTENE